MRTTLKLIIVLAIVILAISFIKYNPWLNQANPIRFLGYRTIPIPLSVVIPVAVLLGAIIASGSMFISQLGLKKQLRLQVKKTSQLEAELHSLRNLPLMEPELKPGPNKETESDSAPVSAPAPESD